MKKTMAVLAVLAVAAAAQADLLASWNFTGSNSTDWDAASPIAATSLGANVASASLSTEKITASGANNALRATGASWGSINEDPLTANRASYIGVTLNAASGYELTVTDIQMNMAGSGTGGGGKAAWSDGTQLLSDAWTTGSNSALPVTLTTQPTGSKVDLRLVASLTATGGTWGFASVVTSGANKSLIINGTTAPATAVPEPATMSLLGLGALAMALRRKLRK